MIMRSLAGMLLFAVGLVAGPAAAERVPVGPDALELLVPAGYCVLSESYPVERGILEQQRRLQAGRNRVLLAMALCAELARLRKGDLGDLRNYGLWLLNTPSDRPALVPDQYSRLDIINEISKQLPKLDRDGLIAAMLDKTRSEGLDIKIKQEGVIGQDENGLYMGLHARLPDQGLSRDVAGVTGLTMLGRRVVSLSLYRDYDDHRVYEVLLEEMKSIIEQTIGKNDGANLDAINYPGGMTAVGPQGGPPGQPARSSVEPATDRDGLIVRITGGAAVGGAVVAVGLLVAKGRRRSPRRGPKGDIRES